MDWRSVLFGWPARDKREAKDQPDASQMENSPSGGNGGEAVHAHVPETELRSSQQHKWLFEEGVLRWNQHRHDKEFKPNFAGLNFVKEAAKTRLWGCPIDLTGEERVVLTGIDLSYADLQGCILTKADLRNAKLIGADLRKVNFAGALLNGADLTDCDLRGATLDAAQFARCKLAHANLAGASLKGVNFAWADLSHAIVGVRHLQDANVFGCVRDSIRSEGARHPVPALS
ncbi:MAG: pentapeptide repeat-containing protein [Alphaproteobacteria bacterium]|nr:pentapeptide repeat-containing protein [Alphaproteobacteria bacterium]